MDIISNSEYGGLNRVLIQPPSDEQARVLPFDGIHPLLDSLPISSTEASREYQVFRSFLEDEVGVENVVTLNDLLVETIEQADRPERRDILDEVVGRAKVAGIDHYVDTVTSGSGRLETIEAARIARDIINGYPRDLELVDGEVPQLLFAPKRTAMWARDSIAATPIGAIICSMAKPRRADEPALFGTVFKHHPDFGDDTIAVDLPALERRDGRRYVLEGGNVQLHGHIVTIGMGHPNADYASRTNAAGAEVVTRELFARDTEGKVEQIMLVDLPDLPINIHLDSVFNMVGPKSAVAMPYIFGHPDKPANVIGPIMRRLAEDMEAAGEDTGKLPGDTDYDNWGGAVVYTRESLARASDFESGGIKVSFLGHLATEGLLDLNNVAWVGGNIDDHPGPVSHAMAAFNEQSSLAANVFATGPYRAIAYHRNHYTINRLGQMMTEQCPNAVLVTMPSNELRTTWGGPHCLTLPLQRELI